MSRLDKFINTNNKKIDFNGEIFTVRPIKVKDSDLLTQIENSKEDSAKLIDLNIKLMARLIIDEDITEEALKEFDSNTFQEFSKKVLEALNIKDANKTKD